MTEIAKPWKSKRVVGPHVVEPQKDPIRVGASPYVETGEYRYQWVCKYCDEKSVSIRGIGHVAQDCDGVEWLDSELMELKS